MVWSKVHLFQLMSIKCLDMDEPLSPSLTKYGSQKGFFKTSMNPRKRVEG